MRARTIGYAISAVSLVGIFIGAYILGMTQREVVREVVIKVDYYDSWNLTLTSNGEETQYTNFGRGVFLLGRGLAREWKIVVHCVKKDGLHGKLIVRVLDVYGNVLEQAMTNEPFGEVKITLEL